MKRRILQSVTVLSLIALLAIGALWVRSYAHTDGLSADLRSGSQLRGGSGIWSMGGRVVFDTTRHMDVSRVPGLRGWAFSTEPANDKLQFVDYAPVNRFHLFGFRIARSLSPSGDGTTVEFAAVAVPYWLLALMAALLPIAATLQSVSRARRRSRDVSANDRTNVAMSAVPATA